MGLKAIDGSGRRGFTWVELLIVVVVLGGVVAGGIYFLTVYQRARLQAMANSEPGKVFQLEFELDDVEFIAGSQSVFRIRIRNMTRYPLKLPFRDRHANGGVYLADTNGKVKVTYINAVRILLDSDDEDSNLIARGIERPEGIIVAERTHAVLEARGTIDYEFLIDFSKFSGGERFEASVWFDSCSRHTVEPTPGHFVRAEPFSLTIQAPRALAPNSAMSNFTRP